MHGHHEREWFAMCRCGTVMAKVNSCIGNANVPLARLALRRNWIVSLQRVGRAQARRTNGGRCLGARQRTTAEAAVIRLIL